MEPLSVQDELRLFAEHIRQQYPPERAQRILYEYYLLLGWMSFPHPSSSDD